MFIFIFQWIILCLSGIASVIDNKPVKDNVGLTSLNLWVR